MEIWAYLDDSGHEDAQHELYLAIGGATAPLDIWAMVAQRWSKALEGANLRPFHVREFERFRKTNPEKAKILIDDLIKIVDEFLLPVVAWGNQRAYDAALRPPPNTPNQKRALDFAVQWCFERVVSRVGSNDIVHIVFSKTPEYVGRVAEIHTAVRNKHPFGKRLGDITLDHTPRTDIHLQVADLVVSGFIKGWKHNSSPLDVPLDWYDNFCENVFIKHQHEWKYFSFPTLSKWKSILDEP